MVMNAAVRANFDEIKELAFGGVSGAYAPIGTPLGHNVRVLTVQNYTNQPVYISANGVTNNVLLYPGVGRIYDLMGNKSGYSQSFYFPEGTQFYAKQNGISAPTSGSVVIEMIFGKGE